MSMIPILDAGHGGVINGTYQTAGKRSPDLGKGVLYEGAFNRWVVNRLIEKLDRANIPYYHVSPELLDVSLESRVQRVNTITQSNKNVYLLSIHANAGGGQGIEAFTTVGNTSSDALAEIFLTDLELQLPNQKMRFDKSDGDKDKESDFYVLRKSSCPAILVETGFMDNQVDYNNLWSEDYINKVVEALFKSIKSIYGK